MKHFVVFKTARGYFCYIPYFGYHDIVGIDTLCDMLYMHGKCT